MRLPSDVLRWTEHSKDDLPNAILGHILEVYTLIFSLLLFIYSSVCLTFSFCSWCLGYFCGRIISTSTTKNSLKEQKLGTIELEYEKKLSAATHVLELAETEQAKERSEKESCQNKIQDLGICRLS